MSDYIIIAIFLLIIWLYIYRWHSAVRITYIAGEKKLNEDEEFTWIEYGGEEYPIQKEMLNAWNNLKKTEKFDWVQRLKKKEKDGLVVKEVIGGKPYYKTTEKDKQICYHKDKYYNDPKFLK